MARPKNTQFERSVYFYEADGIAREFAAWTRALPRDGDVNYGVAKTVAYRALEPVK
jgi:hypothetical protein